MTMSIRRGAAALAAVTLLALPVVAQADNKHVSEAIEHAKGAANHGKHCGISRSCHAFLP